MWQVSKVKQLKNSSPHWTGNQWAAVYLNQFVQPDLVSLHLLFCRLVFLQFSEDVGGVSVRLVLRHFKLLLHPQQQLVWISLELLQHQTSGKLMKHCLRLIALILNTRIWHYFEFTGLYIICWRGQTVYWFSSFWAGVGTTKVCRVIKI